MEVRIYYEDTDAGGVVYHARYLHYMERARTEFMREHGESVQQMHEEGTMFPVVHIDINFRSPARLDDLLEVETTILEVRNSAFIAGQRVVHKKDRKVVAEARVTLACVSEEMKAKRIPPKLRELLVSLIPEDIEI